MSKQAGNLNPPGRPQGPLAQARSSLRTRLRVEAFIGVAIIGAWLYYTVSAVVGLYDLTLTIERNTEMRERVQEAQAGLNEAEEGIDRYTVSGQGYDLSRHHSGRSSLSTALGAIEHRAANEGGQGLSERAQAAEEFYEKTADRTLAAWDAQRPSQARVLRSDLVAPAAENLREVLVELQQRFARSEAIAEEHLKDSRDLAWAAIAILAALIVAGLIWLLADVNRRILAPCATAAEAMEALASDRPTPKLPDQANDEIGDLGRHFNRLADLYSERARLIEERDIEASVNAVLSEAATVNDLKGFGSRVLDKILEVSGASVAVLYLPEPDGSFAAAISVGGGGFQDSHVGREEAQRAARQRRPTFLTVDARTPTVNLFDGRILPHESAHIPLVYFDRVVGVLALGAAETFTRRARTALTAIAPSLAVALANASANEQVADQSQRLTEQNVLLEEQRARIERTARELQRASVLKDRFLASVSHELRTPMTVILGFTGALLRGSQGELNTQQRESLDRVQRNAKLLLRLINDVLDISKIESGKMEVSRQIVALAPFLEQVRADFSEEAARRGLELTTELAAGLDEVTTDPAKISQILANLVGNALKFTEKGSISVHIEPRSQDRWALLVTDTGIGVPSEEQDSIFEEFRQGESDDHRGRGGTGLGLAIVRKLALALGGTVTLESSPGRGSTFTVLLPRVGPAALPQPAPVSDFPPAQRQGQRTVLVVDDDEGIRKLLAFELATHGIRVLEAPDGRQGLVIARESVPDAILLDVLMPGLDGWQTLRALKADSETRSIPVIMLSIVENRAYGMGLGAFDYLIKPLQRDSLFAALTRVGALATGGYILIVEDDPSLRTLLEQELVAAGYAVRTAEGGNQALESLEREPPAAVLLDLMMPAPDGFEVLYRIRANPAFADIKIIIMTAKDLTPADEQILSGSVKRVIRKDGDADRLVEEILRTISQDRGRTRVA